MMTLSSNHRLKGEILLILQSGSNAFPHRAKAPHESEATCPQPLSHLLISGVPQPVIAGRVFGTPKG